MLVALVLIASPAAASVPQLVFAEGIRASETPLTLSDITDVRILPKALRERAAGLEILPADSKNKNVVYDHRMLASRARSLMPVLGPWLNGSYEGRLLIDRPDNLPVALCSGKDGSAQKGATMIIQVTSGPFQIERQATALQSAAVGQRFFAQTADGQTITTRCGI